MLHHYYFPSEMAGIPSPDEVLCSTTGKANFQRVARLLISGGTSLSREIFDIRCPPSNLPTILKNPATVRQLKAAKLTKPQWDCLYPSPGVYGKSTDFDVTLLFKLLRTICSLSPPATGWDALPTSTDHSLAADLARIKFYRNSVYGHVNQKMEIPDDKFPQLWQEIRDALVGVARQISPAKETEWQKATECFLQDPLTAEEERNVEELMDWYRNDMEVKKSVEKLKVTTQEGMERLETSLKGAQEAASKEVQGGLEESTHVLKTAVREETQDIKDRLREELLSTKEVQKGIERLETSVQEGLEGTTHELETAVREEAQYIKDQLKEELQSTKVVQDGIERLETRVQGRLEESTHVLKTAVREQAQEIKDQLKEELQSTKEVHDGLERLETSVQGVLEGSTHVLETAVREEAQGIKDTLGEMHQSINRLSSADRSPQAAGGQLK